MGFANRSLIQNKINMKKRKEIALSEKEAIAIAECLETLAAMSGAFDEHFTRECKVAEKYSAKIRKALED